jgi:hypothetical protein
LGVKNSKIFFKVFHQVPLEKHWGLRPSKCFGDFSVHFELLLIFKEFLVSKESVNFSRIDFESLFDVQLDKLLVDLLMEIAIQLYLSEPISMNFNGVCVYWYCLSSSPD